MSRGSEQQRLKNQRKVERLIKEIEELKVGGGGGGVRLETTISWSQ